MCAGAIIHARLGRVVYGVKDDKAGGAGLLFNIIQHPSLNHRADVLGGVRGPECLQVLQDFFKLQRAKTENRG